jgi:hypothetical protein
VAAPNAMEITNGDTAMEDAIAEANELFNNMGIAAPYVYVFDDESEVSHAAGMEPPESKDKDEEKKEDALYARNLPTPNKPSWVIPDVGTDTTFTEF